MINLKYSNDVFIVTLLSYVERKISMNEKALKTLEFDKIKNILRQKAVTAWGKEKCENLEPSSNMNIVKKNQKETSEAVSLILRIRYTTCIKCM